MARKRKDAVNALSFPVFTPSFPVFSVIPAKAGIQMGEGVPPAKPRLRAAYPHPSLLP